MGRMLEVFKQDSHADDNAEETLAQDSHAEQDVELETANQEMPFIEVGSGAAGVDASPDVRALMKEMPQSVRLAPILTLHQPHEPIAPKSKPILRPRLVTYRPFSAEAEGRSAARKHWWHKLHSPKSPQALEFQALLQELTTSTSQATSQSWLFTSQDDDLATALTLRLALVAADLGGKQAVIIDAKGRQANLGEMIGLPEAPGLKEFLRGETSLDQIMRESGYGKLMVITAGLSSGGWLDRPVGLACHQLLDQLHDRFSWIFIDAGRWRNQSEPELLASFCSGVFMAVKEESEANAEALDLANNMRARGIALKGSIVVGRFES
jgi:Mrp family chromosome partitioning ATPase